MAKLIYKNEKGQSLEFINKPPLVLTSIGGLGSPKNQIYKIKSPYQDGSTPTSSNLEDRELILEGAIFGLNKKKRQEYRSKLIKIFNPKLNGELLFERYQVVRKIDCIPELAPFFPSNMQENYQTFSIQLMCPNPFWEDIYETTKEIITWIGGLTFPVRLPTTFSMAGEKIINIYNDGDVEVPIRLEITGTATNPKIINRDTGEFIKVNRTLTVEDTLIITTDFGNKRVELNNQNVFNYIELGSTFFNLEVGDNVIELTTDDISESANVKITYKNRYLGV